MAIETQQLENDQTLTNRSKTFFPPCVEQQANAEEQFDASLEQSVLKKLDTFLKSLEDKLESFEKYLNTIQPLDVENDSDEDQSQVQYSNNDNDNNDNTHTRKDNNNGNDNDNDNGNDNGNGNHTHSKLFETLKSIKVHMALNHEHNIHPLSQILDQFYQNEHKDKDAFKDENHNPTKYERMMKALQILDERINEFERKYNVMPQHPQDRLKKLKDSLYNYDKVLSASSHRHLNFYELPFQWRENKYIIFGYRFNSSHKLAWEGISCCHNESVNIWSHLLGAIAVALLGYFHFPNTDFYKFGSTMDHMIMYQYIAASIICLLFSVIWHTYTNISVLSLRSSFACFDYSGITILIIASIIPTEHIVFFNHNILYLLFISFSLLSGIVGLLFVWHPFFDKPESRPFRILFFLSLAGLGGSVFVISAYIYGFSKSFNIYSPILMTIIWYLSGVFFYGALFPERYRTDVIVDEFEICDETIIELDKNGQLDEYLNKQPLLTGKTGFWSLYWVDYIGSSHNFWHLFVLGGIIGHYWAMLQMFKRAGF